MNKSEQILCRVLLRRLADGEELEAILQEYPLLSPDALERVKYYVEHH